MIPAHVQQTLADIRALREQIEATERTLLAIWLPEVATPSPSPSPPVRAVTPAGPRRITKVKAAPGAVEEPEPQPEPEPEPRTRRGPDAGGSKYDERLLRALRSEQAQFGMTTSDLCRVFTGPGKPKEVQRISGGVSLALQSLQKRGLVRKDGRHWHVVREAASA